MTMAVWFHGKGITTTHNRPVIWIHRPGNVNYDGFGLFAGYTGYYDKLVLQWRDITFDSSASKIICP